MNGPHYTPSLAGASCHPYSVIMARHSASASDCQRTNPSKRFPSFQQISSEDDRTTLCAQREASEEAAIFQSIQKHTYLKGRYDKITSVAIPLALATTSGFMTVRGIYNMSHGIGKKE